MTKSEIIVQLVRYCHMDGFDAFALKWPSLVNDGDYAKPLEIKAARKNVKLRSSHLGFHTIDIATGNILYMNNNNYIVGNILNPNLYAEGYSVNGYLSKSTGGTKGTMYEFWKDRGIPNVINPLSRRSLHEQLVILTDIDREFPEYSLPIRRTNPILEKHITDPQSFIPPTA